MAAIALAATFSVPFSENQFVTNGCTYGVLIVQQQCESVCYGYVHFRAIRHWYGSWVRDVIRLAELAPAEVISLDRRPPALPWPTGGIAAAMSSSAIYFEVLILLALNGEKICEPLEQVKSEGSNRSVVSIRILRRLTVSGCDAYNVSAK